MVELLRGLSTNYFQTQIQLRPKDNKAQRQQKQAQQDRQDEQDKEENGLEEKELTSKKHLLPHLFA